MDKDAWYVIDIGGGKQSPLKSYQEAALYEWFEGKSIDFFRPKKFEAGVTHTLEYIDTAGHRLRIVPVGGGNTVIAKQLDPSDSYQINIEGKMLPLNDLQQKSLKRWFKGEAFNFFKPKKFVEDTTKLYYLDNYGRTHRIMPMVKAASKKHKIKSSPEQPVKKTKTHDMIVSAKVLKTISPKSFQFIEGAFSLKAHQELAVRKWQDGEDGDGMLEVDHDKLYYITLAGERMQICAMMETSSHVKDKMASSKNSCEAVHVDITDIVNDKHIYIHTKSFAGDPMNMEPSYSKGDHALNNSEIHEYVNERLVDMAEAYLGAKMQATDNGKPIYLFNGSTNNYCESLPKEKFIWTEPKIKEREQLIWPFDSVLKTCRLTRIMGSTPIVLENAPSILGYITIFKVDKSLYNDHGPLIVVNHDSSTVPAACRKNTSDRLCARAGYHGDDIDAVILRRQQDVGSGNVKVAMVIAIGNKFSKI